MIEPHSILTQTLTNRPPVAGERIVYKWGDEFHLNKILKLYETNNESMYPLIYNVSNTYNVDNVRGHILYEPLRLVIATRNTKIEWHNGQRWATSYNNVLFPVVQNIIKLFSKSQVFLWEENYKLFEFPNYGNGKENEATDIWDALRLETNITITERCFKQLQSTT